MKHTKIEWCDHTVNFWWGCAKVSEACKYCYAAEIANRYRPGIWGTSAPRWFRVDKALAELLKLDRAAKKAGRRDRVFINSMSDTFESWAVDPAAMNIARFSLFEVAHVVTNLDLLLLTKRPENIKAMVPISWMTVWPDNVWIGTTVENQQCADHRIPYLLELPARVRFLSCEPLLGPVTFQHDWIELELQAFGGGGVKYFPRIDWVIVGGESGSRARPMEEQWARGILGQCRLAAVPFFMKQLGGRRDKRSDIDSITEDIRVREFPQ